MGEPSNPIFNWIEKSTNKKKHEGEKKEHKPSEKDRNYVIAEAEAVFIHNKRDKSEKKEPKVESEKKVKEHKAEKEKKDSGTPRKREEKESKSTPDRAASEDKETRRDQAQAQHLFEKLEDANKKEKSHAALIPKSPRSVRDSESKAVTENIAEAYDNAEFLASDYVTTDAALAKEILARARKPTDTVVGKVLLVYRKKDSDPCPEASHIITIRYVCNTSVSSAGNLMDFGHSLFRNKTKGNSTSISSPCQVAVYLTFRDKNGEVELHVCGDWVIDVEKLGTKTKKVF